MKSLLRVPLFYKILIANGVLVMVGAAAGVWATTYAVRQAPEQSAGLLIALLAAIGVLASVGVNVLILRVALRPLAELEDTAERVQDGDLNARATVSPVADRALERLIVTFNEMLDSVTATQDRLREMTARALHAAEEERKRIALELHDETAQSLAALLVRLRLARSTQDGAARDALLEEVRTQIAAALEGVRRFAHGLRPPALDLLGLAQAVEAHARDLARITGIRIETDAEPLAGRLKADVELALYRLLQEALSNAVRHASPSLIRVTISADRLMVHAAVEDDGTGFEVEDAMRAGLGLGLFGMQERAAYVGGRVTVTSAPGAGTRVEIKIPVAEAGEHV